MMQEFKSEIKLLLIVALIAVILAAAGILLLKTLQPASPAGGPAPVAQVPPAPSPQPQAVDTSGWQTYRNAEFGVQFQYPSSYTIASSAEDKPCFSIVPGDSCVLALTINADNNSYAPNGYFYLIKGINSVNIQGQVQNIEFDVEMNAWVIRMYLSDDVLQTWDYTSFGNEIIKTSNGGSGGNSAFYIIPDYTNDVVTIFQVPTSRRLWCESMEQGLERDACESFYRSVIDKYSEGEADMVQTWLPKGYFESLYEDTETMISTFRFTQ